MGFRATPQKGSIMKNKFTSIVLLLLAAMIWGFAFVAQKFGGTYLSNFYLNGIRFIIGGLVLIPVYLMFEKDSKSSNKITVLAGIAAGVILFVAANLQQWGINITGSSGKSGFLTAMYSVFVPIFALVFLRKRTGRNTWIGAIISLVGLFLILAGDMVSKEAPFLSIFGGISVGTKVFDVNLSVGFGDIVLLLCAVAFAVHVLFIDHFGPSISPIKFSSTQFLTAGVISTFIALFTETITVSAFNNSLMALLYLGIMSTGVAYTLQVIGQKGAHPTVAAIVLSSESMFAVIGGMLFAGENMDATALIGCGIMMAGIIIAQIPSKGR